MNQAEWSVLQLTDEAKNHLKSLIEQNQENKGVRIAVIGGGCSGLSYKVEFGEKKEKDYVLSFEGGELLIDPKSAIYIKDTVLDYEGGLEGKGFVFKNPNAKNTCGCGESFSI
jgi:iron-sulfur cluster assembly protein